MVSLVVGLQKRSLLITLLFLYKFSSNVHTLILADRVSKAYEDIWSRHFNDLNLEQIIFKLMYENRRALIHTETLVQILNCLHVFHDFSHLINSNLFEMLLCIIYLALLALLNHSPSYSIKVEHLIGFILIVQIFVYNVISYLYIIMNKHEVKYIVLFSLYAGWVAARDATVGTDSTPTDARPRYVA